jgi:hypothetical protein
VADVPDRHELLTALTTEHFTLQGARAQTMSESSSRAALYIGSVSSTLVALGFLGQISQAGDIFNTFALVVLPTLYLLGVFTFVRLVECSAEDFRYALAINRIRNYYQQLAGEQARLFLLSGHDDATGVFGNMKRPARGAHAVLHVRQRGRGDRQRHRRKRGGDRARRPRGRVAVARHGCRSCRRGRLGRRLAAIRGSPARSTDGADGVAVSLALTHDGERAGLIPDR